MGATPAVGSFPSPYEVETPAGCEGWEAMYPYYACFDEERREADEQRFWFWNSMHFPVPMPAFDAICIDTAYQALGTWQNRVFAVPPAMGIDWRCLNGYIYISGNPVTDPAKIAERAGFFQKRAGHYFAELGRPLREVAHEDGGADRGARGARGTAAPRVRARRGRLRGSGDELLRRSRRVPDGAPARRSDVAEPFRVPAARLRRLHDVLRALQGQPPDIPDQHIAQMVAGLDVLLFKPDAELRRLARLAIDTGVAGGVRRGPLAGRDRRGARRHRGRPGLARRARSDQGPVVPHGHGRRPLPHLWQLVRRSDDPVRLADRLRRRARGGRGDRAPDRPHRRASATASPTSTRRCSTTTRGRDSRSCSRSRARSSRTWRSTSSSATTGS